MSLSSSLPPSLVKGEDLKELAPESLQVLSMLQQLLSSLLEKTPLSTSFSKEIEVQGDYVTHPGD